MQTILQRLNAALVNDPATLELLNDLAGMESKEELERLYATARECPDSEERYYLHARLRARLILDRARLSIMKEGI